MPRLVMGLENFLAKLKILARKLMNDEMYNTAYDSIGIDLSTVAENEVACAEAVSRIIQKAFPELRFPTIVSTIELYAYFKKSPSFTEVDAPQYGDIILCVTGTGNGNVSHGHTGVVGRTWIMSNDSRTGTWEANFTPEGWRRYYETKGGFKSHYFRRT